MSEYPDSDFPWTLYFQGVPMPKWANCWHFQPVVDDSAVEWHVAQVYGRMHHVGNIESEEADIFLIAAQQVLLQAIDQKEAFANTSNHTSDDRETIHSGFISGLQQMIKMAETAEVVFWTGGYQKDCEALLDAMRRFRLGSQHPEYFQPRHRVERHRDRIFLLNGQRKEMRQRLTSLGSDKMLKRFIHELKDRPSP